MLIKQTKRDVSIIITLTKEVYSFGYYIQRIIDLKPVRFSLVQYFQDRVHKRPLLPPFWLMQWLILHPHAYVQESGLKVPKLMEDV